MKPADVPFIINWFEDPTSIAHSLGLALELPDVNNEDPAYWAHVDRQGWRTRLTGKIQMTAEEMAHEDPDWVRLKRLGGTVEVWFDLEEGIRFKCRAIEVGYVVSIVRQLATLDGLLLARQWPGNVIANQAVGGSDIPNDKELASLLEPAGFRWNGRNWDLLQF